MEYMRHNGNRTINVSKQQLIDKIKENKLRHIEEYGKAVVAYKKEALKQLKELNKKASNGEMDLKLELVTPKNVSKEYDKIIEMFEWEVEDVVELEQREFTQYVQDETDFAVSAKFSNMTYF